MTHEKEHAWRKIPSDHTDGPDDPPLDAVVKVEDSIQSAVDSASAGDIIGISGGTFSEQVVVDKDVTLFGLGGTTISAPATLTARFRADGDLIHPIVSLEADGAALWNLTVDGEAQGRGNERFVGVAGRSASVYVGDVTVRDVRAADEQMNGRGIGILARHCDTETERLAYIERCAVNQYRDAGIVGEGEGLDLQISESIVTGHGPTATTAQNGIVARKAPQVTLVGNSVTGNYHVGNTASAGVVLYRTADAFVAWNVLDGNGCGLGTKCAGDIVARRNNIRLNGIGVLDRGSATVDATNNWWGAEDGPSASQSRDGGAIDTWTGSVADGSGDAVYDVHWDPYSSTPFALGSAGPESNRRDSKSGHHQGRGERR